MDSTASSAGATSTTRRGQRESSYHPMASDTDSDGGISDGDPPDYSGGPRPAPIAPPPTLGAGGVPKKRSFDELEDIVFSNPKSFVALAKDIADSRGVQLLIGDDRTHKVSSAYMHIHCAFRRAGCPFIIKLTKAKEGGWLIRGGKTSDLETKQRSNYRCRHPAGSRADLTSGTAVEAWMRKADPRSSSHPDGSRPRAAKLRSTPVSTPHSTPSHLDPGAAQDESSAGRAPRTSARAAAARNSIAAATPSAPPSASSSRLLGAAPPTAPVSYAAIEPERALAPPFQRAIDLQAQIVPALSPRQQPHSHHPQQQSMMYASGYSPRSYQPSVTGGGGGDPYRLLHSPSQGTHPRAPPPSTSSHRLPPPAADPAAVSAWTAVLAPLGDTSLLPLARILASPLVSCTPASFFTEPRDARQKLLDALPGELTGLWPKIKLARRLGGEEGERVWAGVQRRQQRERDQAGSNEAAGGGDDSREVSVDGSDASAAQVRARILGGATKAEPGDDADAETVLSMHAPQFNGAQASPGTTAASQSPAVFAAAPGAPAVRSSPARATANVMDVDSPVGVAAEGLGAPVSAGKALSPAAGLIVASPPPASKLLLQQQG